MILRPQFCLRSLFFLTLVVAVGCWVANSWSSYAPRFGPVTVHCVRDGRAEITWESGRREFVPARPEANGHVRIQIRGWDDFWVAPETLPIGRFWRTYPYQQTK
jgi:hypothetical protein